MAKAAKQGGGPEVVAQFMTCAAVLRAVSQDAATVPGTPAERERLDLLDGIIVGLARDARKAAHAAANEPAMAAAFELTKLDGSSKAKKEDAKVPPAAAVPEEKPPKGGDG